MITFHDQEVVEPHNQFKHERGTVLMDETLVMERVKTLKIANWTLSQDTQVRKINMGTIEDPKFTSS